tara:strand:- start:46412 stop:47182 length:771 start_codon:yes stop_codon:yes gene_type:complete
MNNLKNILHSFVFILLMLGMVNSGSAQKSIRDSAIIIPHIDLVYSFQLPAGDLVNRFGFYHTIGGAFYVKDRKGFVYGFDGQVQFGDQLKEDPITNFTTSNNQVINGDGNYATMKGSMRGFRFTGQFGKVFNILSPNPNSGLKVIVGAGFWQHRIRVEDTENKVAQVKFPYQNGYDRMTNGFMLTEFVGYQFFSESRLVNFYFGVEFNQGFTKNRRKYNFSEKRRDDRSRLDLSYGFKLGWVIPMYRRAPKEFYYN